MDLDSPPTQTQKVPTQASKSSTSSSASTTAGVPSTKNKNKPPRGYEISSKTIKTQPFAYACLELISSSPPSTNTTALDALTTRTHLTSALMQFLGLTGSAISVDVLKICAGKGAGGDEVWIRVPAPDLAPVLAAVGGWVGRSGVGGQERVSWRVMGSGLWLGGVLAGTEEVSIWRD